MIFHVNILYLFPSQSLLPHHYVQSSLRQQSEMTKMDILISFQHCPSFVASLLPFHLYSYSNCRKHYLLVYIYTTHLVGLAFWSSLDDGVQEHHQGGLNLCCLGFLETEWHFDDGPHSLHGVINKLKNEHIYIARYDKINLYKNK